MAINFLDNTGLSYVIDKIKSSLSTVAFSGDYTDLDNIPNLATTDTNGLMSSTDKGYLNNLYSESGLGSCTTARNTTDKVVTLSDFVLRTGSVIRVRFTNTGTSNPSSGNLTLNVNSTGAKTIVDGKSNKTVCTYSYAGNFYNNMVHEFVYDGTYWVWLTRDDDTTYTPQTLGFGYGTCSTAAATKEKAVTLSGFTLVKNGIVAVKFTNSVPAGASMNINSTGAKYVAQNGSAIADGVISAGDMATFIYDGNWYHLLSIDLVTRLKKIETYLTSEMVTVSDGVLIINEFS